MENIYSEMNVYWDRENQVPVILNERIDKKIIRSGNYSYMGTDFRPVFLEEKWLLINLFPDLFSEKLLNSSVWVSKQNKYFIDGEGYDISPIKKANEFNISELRSKVSGMVFSKEILLDESKIFQKFVEFNKERFNYLIKSNKRDKEGHYIGAYPFIHEIAQKYKDRLMLVSFSGGKDSTVTSHLVRKALNTQEILHIYGDTTLELPRSYEYVERFKKENPFTPFFDERNEENNFFEMCREIGPPSRVKSWCCSIFKTGPMGTTLANFDEDMLTFLGVRRSESSSRSKYDKVAQSPKILKQIVACPVIDWLDIEIWLYIFTEKLDFNFSYRQGFSRVGCWVCPHNGNWSQLLSSIYNAKEYDVWYEFLIEFAKNIGKEDYENYVKDGKWKARQGGQGIEKSQDIILESKECVNESNSKNYILNKNINADFYNLFKPFGKQKIIKRNNTIENIILNRKNEPIFKMIFSENSNRVKITVMNSDDRYIFNKIEKQLNKFNSCLYCQGCNSACPVGAISVTNNVYKIDEAKCINCLKCIDKFDSGCLISSALKIKKGV